MSATVIVHQSGVRVGSGSYVVKAYVVPHVVLITACALLVLPTSLAALIVAAREPLSLAAAAAALILWAVLVWLSCQVPVYDLGCGPNEYRILDKYAVSVWATTALELDRMSRRVPLAQDALLDMLAECAMGGERRGQQWAEVARQIGQQAIADSDSAEKYLTYLNAYAELDAEVSR